MPTWPNLISIPNGFPYDEDFANCACIPIIGNDPRLELTEPQTWNWTLRQAVRKGFDAMFVRPSKELGDWRRVELYEEDPELERASERKRRQALNKWRHSRLRALEKQLRTAAKDGPPPIAEPPWDYEGDLEPPPDEATAQETPPAAAAEAHPAAAPAAERVPPEPLAETVQVLREQSSAPVAKAPEREPVPPRLRFEVFKRDKFTCQYCGQRAPDVVLQVDHIKPVAGGGTSDILNLITSCAKCNGGKGAIPLTDTLAIDRQMEMMAELQERREQLDMLLRWRDELQNLQTDTLKMLETRIVQRGGFLLTENDRSSIKKWLKRFSMKDLLRATDEAFDTYLFFKNDGTPFPFSFDDAFKRIPGIAHVMSQEETKPYLKRLYYIQGIVRKRIHNRRFKCVPYLEHIHLAGMELEEIERYAKKIDLWTDFERPMDQWLAAIKRPYVS